MFRNSSQHWPSSRWLGFAEWRIDSTQPWLRRGQSCPFICIWSPRCFFSSSWWCVDTEDDKEDTLGHRVLPVQVRWDASTDFHVEPISFTIAYVDRDIAGKRVGENNTQLFWWHWPGDVEFILLTFTSIIDITILSIVCAAIARLPDSSQPIQGRWGFWEMPDGDGGQYAHNGTPIFDNNTAAGWVKVAMKWSNPKLFSFVYHG